MITRDLTERGLWTPEVRNQIIADQGSVQRVRDIPQDLKDLYKTVWEIKQKVILNQVRVSGKRGCLRHGTRPVLRSTRLVYNRLRSAHVYMVSTAGG